MAGAAISYFLLGGGESAIDEMVPSSAHLYVTAYLEPAAGQKVRLLQLARKFPELRDTDSLNRRID